MANGLHFKINLMAKCFSWMMGWETLSSLELFTGMLPVARAMVPSLVSIGFAARGLLCGPP